ncbi:lytic transglycosylase domain-containing protein [Vibrio harveyi]|uniref:lytic transglycosylase domain-containing protein n=1 Tax=Vibrio harveyi TaxID=669 RepID=UPI003CEBA686
MKRFLLAVVLIFVTQSALASVQLGMRNYQGTKQYQGWVPYFPKAKEIPLTQPKPKPIRCVKYCQQIKAHSRNYGVPANLITAMIYQESRFNPNAISSKGAKGLMQLMDFNSVGIDPFNPNQNIKAGTALMARLLKKYNNDVSLALAAYNAGEGNVKKYRGIPPFPETRQYINNILNYYQP